MNYTEVQALRWGLCATVNQLTNYKEPSLFWEAEGFSTNQEIIRILWNSKVHYRIH